MESRTHPRPPHQLRARRDRTPATPAVVHSYVLRPSGVRGVTLDEAVDIFARRSEPGPRPMLWIDIICPGPDEESLLRDRLGLHPLAVEDCLRGRQRPKLDRYPGYYFLVVYAARINAERNRAALEELHIFVGERFIITVHDHRLRQVREVVARWRSNEPAFPTTGALAHALIDGVVDSYLPVIEHLGGRVDLMEHEVFRPGPGDQMQRLLELRHEVATARRHLSPLRDMVRTLIRRDILFFSTDLLPYFQDVLDHVERETEELDSLRDTLAATLDAYLSVSANQLNHTMRLMAAWSIILMTMAWIAGIYGMNFERMPELQWPLGYAWSLSLMLGLGATLLVYFRRRGWI